MPTDALAADSFARVQAALTARWPESRLEPSLDRISALVDLLGRPEHAMPVIHVAGTNGKTSTARMIDALLREVGLRTGRFTSPHLDSVTERLCLDGAPLEPDRFVELYDEVAPYLDLVDAAHPGTPLSFFEVLTAMAFALFADAPVDVAVIEVGMGGSWDATNVADAQVAVVMPIGLDHRDYLGDTLEEIAAEKAGIVKPDSVLVMAAQDDAAAEVVLRRAAEVGAEVVREGQQFAVTRREVALGGQQVTITGLAGEYDEIILPLFGEHQAQNAACALAAVEAFLGGKSRMEPDAVRAGFLDVSSPGRLEVVRRSPTVLVDAAHNPHGARALAAAITESFAFERLVGVVAVLGDKDVEGILDALEPVLDHVVVTVNSSPRALPADDLAAVAEDVFGAERVSVEPSMLDAIDLGVARAEEDGGMARTGVLVTGSVITVADARRLFARHSDAAGRS